MDQERTFSGRQAPMSALPPKADITSRQGSVRFVPKADSCTATNSALFNHPVSGRQQRRWDGYTQHPRRVGIDGQLEFRRLHDRQIGGLCALDNAAGINAELPEGIGNVGSVAHQAADFDGFTHRIASWDSMIRRELHQLDMVTVERRGRANKDSILPFVCYCFKCGIDLTTAASIEGFYLKSYGTTGRIDVA